MTSRERVLKAVHFEPPDRVPIDLGAFRATGINAVVYDALKKRLGIGTPTKIHDTMQLLAEVEPEVLDRVHGDVLPLDIIDAGWVRQPAAAGVARRLFCGLEVYFPPGTNITEEPDGSWAQRRPGGELFARMPKDGLYFDFDTPTMATAGIDPDAYQPSGDVSDEQLDVVAAHARYLDENTDKAILGWGPTISYLGLSALISANITQGSLDGWLMMLMGEKNAAHDMMARGVDAAIAQNALYHQAVGDRCFAWGAGSDDAGTQRGELIAPDLFREMIIPHYRRLCGWVHDHTHWKTYLHSCGSIYHYIQDWIDAGIDIINPVQISAANMSPERLMRDFGGKVVFWGGGAETQHLLPEGSPDEVRQHVRGNIEAFASGQGGYVFSQVHNIQQNVPVENVAAMLDAAYEYGQLG